MPQINVTDAVRSLKSALLLVLNGDDPETDFANIGTLPVDSNGRLKHIYNGEDLPTIHGPEGSALLYPGLCVEHGQTDQFVLTKFKFYVSVSIIIKTNQPFEKEQEELINFAQPLSEFLYRVQSCPIYEFTPNTDIAISKLNRLNWWQNSPLPLEPISERLVVPSFPDQYLIQEYTFDAYFTQVPY